jgi:DNA-binding FadR family transcriptional regulator
MDMFNMIWGKALVFPLFATIENVKLEKSLGDHMQLIEIIASGDKTEALEVFTAHIQDGFNLQIKGLHAN